MSQTPHPIRAATWKHRRVALLIQTATHWSRLVLSGIARYANEFGGWDFYLEPRGFNERMMLPRGWAADGAIVRLTHAGLRKAIARRRIPAVNVAWLSEHSTIVPKVVADETKCGQLAAEFFLNKGYSTFAFVGPRLQGYADTLEVAFRNRVGDHDYHSFVPDPLGVSIDRARLTRWLRKLPKPVAVVVWDSILCHEVVISCLNASISVPDHVAVLCLEVDPLVSALCPIPLSYVDRNGDGVGYLAAGLLERMMRGYPAPSEPVLVPPLSVVERLSTDAVAVADPALARALRFIRDHAAQPINVADVEQETDLSRRQLEHMFLKKLGQTPAVAIRKARLSLARSLLRNPDLSIDAVAVRSGFQDSSVFIRCFYRETGQTPGAYRKAAGASDLSILEQDPR